MARAEAERRLRSWGSQRKLAEELEKGVNLSHASVADESVLLNEDALSLAFSGSADSALLAPCQEEQEMAVEDEEGETSEPLQLPFPAYDK